MSLLSAVCWDLASLSGAVLTNSKDNKEQRKHGEIKAPNKNSWDVSVQSELQRKNRCGSFCFCWWCVLSDASVSSCLCQVWATACRKAQQPESVSEQQLLVNQVKTVQRNTENRKLLPFSIYSTMSHLKVLFPKPSVVVDLFWFISCCRWR